MLTFLKINLKARYLKIVIIIITIFNIVTVFAQTDTVFWFAIPRVTPKHGSTPAYFHIAAAGATTVTVTMPANPGFTPKDTIFTSKGAKSWDISNLIKQYTNPPTNTIEDITTIENIPYNIVNNKGIKISSSNGPITVYYDEAHQNNTDIFSLKGKNALGVNFYIPFQNRKPNGNYSGTAFSSIEIVATEDNTIVEITPTKALLGGRVANIPFTVTLNKGQTFSCRSIDRTTANHLGGTRVRVTNSNASNYKPIAITIKDDSVEENWPSVTTCYDLQGDQIVPIDRFDSKTNKTFSLVGYEYIAMRGRLSYTSASFDFANEDVANGDQLYIIPIDANTTLSVTRKNNLGVVFTETFPLTKGNVFNLPVKNNWTYIKSNASRLYVYHISGFGCETGAAILPKVDGCTGSTEVTVVRTNSRGGEKLYLNLMVTSSNYQKVYYEVQGSPPVQINPNDFETVGSTSWYVLKHDKKDYTSIMTLNIPVRFFVLDDRFHLGFTDGGTTSGCKYGYFSDYSESDAKAYITNNNGERYRGCLGDTIKLYAEGGIKYKWERVNKSTDQVLTPSFIISSDTISEPKIFIESPMIADYRVTMYVPCFPPVIAYVQVEIKSTANAAFTVSNPEICSPLTTIKINNQSTGNNLRTSWFFNFDTVKIVPDTTIKNTGIFNYTYPVNNGVFPKKYKIRLQARDSLGNQSCYTYQDKIITIYPHVKASLVANKPLPLTACDSTTIKFTSTSTMGTAPIYPADSLTNIWDFGANSGSSPKGDSISETFRNYTLSDITYNARLIAVSSYGCSDTTGVYPITLHPALDAFYTIDKTKACATDSGFYAEFKIDKNNRGKIDEAKWEFGDIITPVFSLNNSLIHTYANPQTQVKDYWARLTVYNSNKACSDTFGRKITVFPSVNANFSPSISRGCNPLPVTFTPTGNNFTQLSYSWNYGDGGPTSDTTIVHTKVLENFTSSVKPFLVTLKVESDNDFGNCEAEITQTILVSSYIKAGFTNSLSEVCGGKVYDSIIIKKAWDGDIDDITWQFDNNIANNKTYTINDQPNSFKHFYNNTTNNKINYRIKQTVKFIDNVDPAFTCIDTISRPIIVYPEVSAAFTASNDKVCDSTTVAFTNISDQLKAPYSYWDFGDNYTSIKKDTVHTYFHINNNSQTYNVKLIASNNLGKVCSDTITKSIEVYPYVNARFNVVKSDSCSPFSARFKSDWAKNNNNTYLWEMRDSANTTDTTYNINPFTYTNTHPTDTAPYPYTVKLTVENGHVGCEKSFTHTIKVYPAVTVNLTATTPITGCNPLTVNFDKSANAIAEKYNWAFGDGATSSVTTNTSHLFENNTSNDVTYPVTLTAQSKYGCSASSALNVSVWRYLDADFKVLEPLICAGDTINFINASALGAVNNRWFFGDGDTTGTVAYINVNHNYVNNTNSAILRTVKLITNNTHAGCDKTFTDTITVYPQIRANFTVDKTSGCNPLTVNISNKSKGDANIFDWDFGNGKTSFTSDTLTPVSTKLENLDITDKNYIISLKATNNFGCTNIKTITDTVFAMVSPVFSIDGNKVCSGKSMIINNNSPGQGKANYTFSWNLDGVNGIDKTDNGATINYNSYPLNKGETPNTIVVTMYMNNNHNCADSLKKTVTIYPEIRAGFKTDTTYKSNQGCFPITATYTDTTKGKPTQWLWQFGDSNEASTKNTSHAYKHNGSVDTLYTTRLIATSNFGCKDTAETKIKTYAYINPAFSFDSTQLCSGYAIKIKNYSPNGENQKHYWQLGANERTITDTTNVSFVYKFTNKKDFKVDTNYITHTVYNTDSVCYLTMVDTVYVHPEIRAGFKADKYSGCYPLSVVFTETSNIAATKWIWNLGAGEKPDFGKIVINTYTQTFDADKQYFVRLIAQSAAGCADTAFDTITVFAEINSYFTKPATICHNDTATFESFDAKGTVMWYWDFNNDNVYDDSTSGSTVKHVFTNISNADTLYSIYLKVRNNHYECTHISDTTLIVNPQLRPNFEVKLNDIKDTVGCNPITRTLDNLTNNAPADYEWLFGDQTPPEFKETNFTHKFENKNSTDAIYTITLKATNPNNQACTYSTSRQVRVRPFIKANFNYIDKNIICNYNTVPFINQSEGGIVKYYWDYEGDGLYNDSLDTNTPPTLKLPNTGSSLKPYPVVLKVRNYDFNCWDTAKSVIKIAPQLRTNFSPTDTVNCNPFNVPFKNLTPLTDSVTYTWNFGDGKPTNYDVNPEHLFENLSSSDSITYTVTLNASGYGCDSSISKTITVLPFLDSTFTIYDQSLCSGYNFEITDNAKAITKNWYINNVPYTRDNTGNKFSFARNNSSDNYLYETVKLEVLNGTDACTKTLSKQITVFPEVRASFTYDQAKCAGTLHNFTNTSSPSGTKFTWYFGDDSNTSKAKDTTRSFNYFIDHDTTFYVWLYAESENGCNSTTTQKPLTVWHNPATKFIPNIIFGCPGMQVTFTNTTNTTGNTTYNWDFGDQATTAEVSPQHDFYNSELKTKNYNVLLTATSDKGCIVKSPYQTITVYPNVKAIFDSVPPACNPSQVQFVNRSIIADAKNVTYEWHFGDVSTDVVSGVLNPSHVFFNADTATVEYTVSLRVTSTDAGCTNQTTRPVKVYAAPDVNFRTDSTLRYFPNNTFGLLNQTKPKGNWQYLWNFGDGKTSADGNLSSYTYTHWGSKADTFKYIIKLVARNQNLCADSATQNIFLKAPIPVAIYTANMEGCSPHTVYFKENSKWNYVWKDGNKEGYEWDFDDSTKSILPNPIHTFVDAGDYNVRLKVKGDGGEGFKYVTIKVYPKPVISFNVEPRLVMLPDDLVRCFNNTVGGSKYLWEFGDGQSSFDPDPSYKYTKMGVYDIKLTAWSDFHCVDSLRVERAVTVSAPGKIVFPSAFTPNMHGPSGGYYQTQDLSNDIFFPYQEGVAEYHLEIYNRWGELIFKSDDVNVGWDGYFKNKLSKQDVYVYKARGKFFNGQTFLNAGDVTIIHKND